jgi:hypothetical protein
MVAKSAPKQFRGKSIKTIEMEQAIIQIVEDRHPITVRGVCYALFTRGLLDSMAVGQTGKVSKIMTAMRENSTLDWTLIVDGSRVVDRGNLWNNPSQIIQAAVNGYRRNYWQEQPLLIEVWSEKSTIQGVLAPVLDEFGVTFRVMKGFGSFTAVRQAAEDSLDIPADRHAIALYIGDRDPSGMYMSEIDLPSRLERYGSLWQFKRIAVLESDTYSLPSFEAESKAGDNRHDWYVSNYGEKCWELDAIDPNDLRQRVREQIETRLDLPAWEYAKGVEAVEVESMKEFHRAWNARSVSGLYREYSAEPKGSR